MNHHLRILHLEDDPDYPELLQAMLRQDGMDVVLTPVSERQQFEDALEKRDYDIIIADFRLPDYNGEDALRAAQQICPEVPFIIVSGTIGEQAAISSLKAGATDFVLKQLPHRLGPAIRRAVHEAEERNQRRRAETELIRREQYFRTLTENSLDLLLILTRTGVLEYASPSLFRVLGYQPKGLVGESVFTLVHSEDLPGVLQYFETALQNPDRTITLQCRLRHQTGCWRHLEAIGQNKLDEQQVQGVVVNLRDITDRKLAEDELRESEEQYRLIFDGNPMPMWVFDHETLSIVKVNDAAVHHYGYSREEFLRMTMDDLRLDKELPAMVEYLHKILAQPSFKSGFSGVWHHRKKDGTVIDVELKWSGIRFRGRPASLTMVNDITERKRVEHRDAALSKLGQSLSSATSAGEAARIIQAVADDLFRIDAFTLSLYNAEEDVISPLLDLDTDVTGHRHEIPGVRPRKPTGLSRRIIEKGAELILREPGAKMPEDTVPFGDVQRPSLSLVLTPIRSGTKVIGVLSIQSYTPHAYDYQDVTSLQTLADHCGGALERIRAEQALHETQQRFRDLFEGSPDAIFVEDASGRVLDVNPAACELHGLGRQELIGMKVADLTSAEVCGSMIEELIELATGQVRQVEGISRTRDGRDIPVEVRASRVSYSREPALLLHVRDITSRKAAQEALCASEMLFHSVWDNSVDSMCLTDEAGRIVTVNAPFCRLVGLPRTELEHDFFTKIFADSQEREGVATQYRRNFLERVTEKQAERHRTLWNGTNITLEETYTFVELAGERTLLLGLFRDVTAQKKLQEQLRHSQKMDAIGQLAGGVAHDFNNILTVIHGHASLLISGGKVVDGSLRSAQQILQAAERAAGLTRQLLTFSRRQVIQLKRLDLNEVVSNLTRMLGRILGEDIALHLQYLGEAAPVQADAGMMEQILLNLAVNSRDAMPVGGVLNISISRPNIGPDYLEHHPEAHLGHHICLCVKDTGCGIPAENFRRIFEPFFTTKPIGKGTGLGLATVYGIVKQHQGWIEVESQPGQGSIFRVFLPPCELPPEQQPREMPATVVRGGSETILVVEDELPVRELVCTLLVAHGYQVIEADSGVGALEVWERNKGQIDLLLTDLVMPGRLNGCELAEKLWLERPQLKVIFTSGYSAEVVGVDVIKRKGIQYLQKPYQPQKLALAIRECLDKPVPTSDTAAMLPASS